MIVELNKTNAGDEGMISTMEKGEIALRVIGPGEVHDPLWKVRGPPVA